MTLCVSLTGLTVLYSEQYWLEMMKSLEVLDFLNGSLVALPHPVFEHTSE